MFGERREIIRVVIHVVSATRLTRPAMTPPIVGNHPIPMLQKEHHLRVPIVGRQRPSVRENDGLPFSPIFVINIYSISRCDRAHNRSSILTQGPESQPSMRELYDHSFRFDRASLKTDRVSTLGCR